jgi:hypothetical protein
MPSNSGNPFNFNPFIPLVSGFRLLMPDSSEGTLQMAPDQGIRPGTLAPTAI